MLYYCVREPDEQYNDTKLLFHRGNRDGPIIAVADPCPEKKYETDIHFFPGNLTIPLRHSHPRHFAAYNRGYHWKGPMANELIEDESNGVVATYDPSVFEGHRMRIGVIDNKQPDMQDIVVITAMVVQERDEECKSKVLFTQNIAN